MGSMIKKALQRNSILSVVMTLMLAASMMVLGGAVQTQAEETDESSVTVKQYINGNEYTDEAETDGYFNVGDSVTLSVEVSGLPEGTEPTYTWYTYKYDDENDCNEREDYESTTKSCDVERTEVGSQDYGCEITYTDGDGETQYGYASFWLFSENTVETQDSIIVYDGTEYLEWGDNWDKLDLKINDSLQLKVQASSTLGDELNYQWYSIDENGETTKLKGETSATLDVKKKNMSKERYRCDIDDGNDLENVYITIPAVETLSVTQKINGEVSSSDSWKTRYKANVGTTINLEVAADTVYTDESGNKHEITYQWLDANWDEIEGATSSVYTVRKGIGEEEYICQVSDGNISDSCYYFYLDNTDTLTVEQYINDMNTDELYDVTYGDSYTLKAEATSTYCDKDAITYEWYTYDSDDEKVSLQDANGKAYGNVSSVTVNKKGYYYVKVSDGNKEETAEFDLDGDDTLSVSSSINGKENTTRYSKREKADSVEMKISAESSVTASDKITYEWSKLEYDEEFGDEYFTPIEGANVATYKTTVSDEKEEYRCKISDGVTTSYEYFYLAKKTSLEVAAVVKANDSVVDTDEDGYYVVKIGDQVELGVDVTNSLEDSALTYKWYDDEDDKISTDSTYTFTKKYSGTEGYSCIVSNGTDKETIYISIYAPSEKTEDFTIKSYINGKESDYLELDSFDGQDITLKVEGTSSTGAALTYEWYYYDDNDEKVIVGSSDTYKVDNSILISDYNFIYCRVSGSVESTNCSFEIERKDYTENASIYIGNKMVNDGDTSITAYAAEGEKVTLKVVPEVEKDTLTYTWYNKNGVKQGEGSSLEVTRTKAKESYICVVKDGSDSTKYYFTLTDTEEEDCKHENVVTDAAVAPTCTTNGRTEGSHCKDCGTVIKAQETVKATGHQWDAGKVTTAATATTKGVKTYTCTVCKATKTEEIPATGNTSNSSTGNKSAANNTALKVGASVTDKKTKAVYRVTGKNTMEYKSAPKKAASVSIPSSVTVNGVKYKVTSIAAKAFKGNKKLKKVVIPATVKKIGKQAFYGCKKLKKITIKTKYLTKKNVGAKAFKGINAKATIKVPKRQLKSYKKMLKSKGVGKKVKIKK